MFNFPPLYPHSSFDFSKKQNNKNILFFNSARSGFYLIIETLKEMYENIIFLIPTYNCYSIIASLESAKVEYNFIDLDESLNFDLNDLEFMINAYSNKKIVLVSTSLFGAKLRDYKSIYKNILVIEDLAQSTFNYNNNAGFSFVSFGKGKMISAWSGGGVITNNELFIEKYDKLIIKNEFFKSYLLSNMQKIISKYFWFFIEKSPLNPEKNHKLEFYNQELFKLSNKKINWILNSIESLNLNHRIEISNYYLNNISKEFLFDLESNTPYLRLPVKKIINKSGISFMKDYEATYQKAKIFRDKEFEIAKKLAYNCSFLPTHNLINLKYAKKIVDLING